MFTGFEPFDIQTGAVMIHGVKLGSGAPLLLLHGYPQTHVIWHKVAPKLAEQFTVIATDLRGYGDSSKPDGGENHEAYSKREMANDQIAVMRHFGFEHAEFLWPTPRPFVKHRGRICPWYLCGNDLHHLQGGSATD